MTLHLRTCIIDKPRHSHGEGREGDGEGAFGEAGRARPALGDGEDHGSFVVMQQGVGGGPGGFVDGGAETGGETAEGIGEGRGEGGDVVQGEDPVVAGEDVEITRGGGNGGKGRGTGVEERAEDTGGEGFAGSVGALEDEEGEGSFGAEGGEEPGEDLEPGGAGGEVEDGAEGANRHGVVRAAIVPESLWIVDS